MKKIDHIGIAVHDLDATAKVYKQLGFTYEKTETVEDQKVRTAFFKVGDSHLELLEATEPSSPIAKFLGRRGPGIHHISIEVDNLDLALKEYREAGIQMAQETPSIGAGGHRIAFVHPKAAGGVLIELMERHPKHS